MVENAAGEKKIEVESSEDELVLHLHGENENTIEKRLSFVPFVHKYSLYDLVLLTYRAITVKKNALIGFSGFVGQTLLKQTQFDELYRSTNISDIRNQSFEMIVCAGAPAAKWFANQHPEEDKAGIHQLMEHLSTVTCQRFVLISTVDVYQDSTAVVESTPVAIKSLHPYGLHRFQLEEFAKEHFRTPLIIRLPGLVGPGLKKNVIYDFLHHRRFDVIDSRGIFQFYPMVNLWTDVQIALQSGQPLVHLTSEPISVDEVAKEGFGFEFNQHMTHQPAAYDFRTELGRLYGTEQPYQYSKKEVLLAIRAYAQSELRQ